MAYAHRYTTYDLCGHPLREELIGKAGCIIHSYDLLQRHYKLEAPQWKEYIPEGGYDSVGNLLTRRVIDPQGEVTYHYTYDPLYQLASESGPFSHQYRYDSLGNCLAYNESAHQHNALHQLIVQGAHRYRYDANGNCIESEREGQLTRYHYDALNRLTAVEGPTGSVNYL